jgi:hypothetical protein
MRTYVSQLCVIFLAAACLLQCTRISINTRTNGDGSDAKETESEKSGDPNSKQAQDSTSPSAQLSTDASSDVVTGPFQLFIKLSESVSSFSVSKVFITNGTASDFIGSDRSFELTVTPTTTGIVTVEIPPKSLVDGSGNKNSKGYSVSLNHQPPPSRYYLFASTQISGGTSRVYKYQLDFPSKSVSSVSSINLSSEYGGGWLGDGIRGITLLGEDKLLVGHGAADLALLDLNLAKVGGTGVWDTDPGNPMPAMLGACSLQNGNVVLTGHRWGLSQNREYDEAGTFVRTVASGFQDSSDCGAVSSTRIIWLDYDANSDQYAYIRISDFVSGSWQNHASSVYTQTMFPSLLQSVWYSLAVHSNGFTYIFPGTLTGSRNQKIVRCSSSGDLSDCVTIGSNLQIAHSDLNIIQGSQQLPGRDLILFSGSTPRKLYLFDPNSFQTEEIANLATLGMPALNDSYGLRDLIVVAE